MSSDWIRNGWDNELNIELVLDLPICTVWDRFWIYTPGKSIERSDLHQEWIESSWLLWDKNRDFCGCILFLDVNIINLWLFWESDAGGSGGEGRRDGEEDEDDG